METMPLEHLMSLIEASVTEAGVFVSDELIGDTSTARRHKSARVGRVSTVNLNEFRDQDIARVEDVVAVELTFEIKPHDQRATRNAAYETSRDVRNKLTDLSDSLMRRNGQTHLDSTEVVEEGWFIITDQYRYRRYEEVGRG